MSLDIPGWDFANISYSQSDYAKHTDSEHYTGYHLACDKGVAWYGFGNSGISGSISTVLNGCGRGILDYGNCLGGNSMAFLNGKEISATFEKREVVEFDFHDGDVLKLVENSEGGTHGILIFHNFHVTNCGLKCKC